jgi:ATP-dependent RNA helicase DeaD
MSNLTFSQMNLPKELLVTLEKQGFENPTKIQSEAIPKAIEGRDILASSKTGSGKTLAFCIPIIANIHSTNGKGLIITPTREIAIQVSKVVHTLTYGLKMHYGLLIGGEPMSKQIMQLKRTPEIIIGTPGRIIDHIGRGTLKLSDITTVVLDEADRMLDMGFEEDIEDIFSKLKPECQKFMFSATFPKRIEKMCYKYLKDPAVITTIDHQNPYGELKKIKQHFHNVNGYENKYSKLHEHLQSSEGTVVVFVKTKSSVDELKDNLKNDGHYADGIHGDLSQHVRRKVIANFREEKYRILVATDVVARGLDVPHVEHVFNFDMPGNFEDYIHRIGRTNRESGKEGQIFNMFSGQDYKLAEDIKKHLGHNFELPAGRSSGGGSRNNRFRSGGGSNFRSSGSSNRSWGDNSSRDGGSRESSSREGFSRDSAPREGFSRDRFSNRNGGGQGSRFKKFKD